MPEAFTVAVRVTDEPCAMLDAELESVVVVAEVVVLTVTSTAFEVDGPSVLVPEYVAVIEWEPADSVEVVKLATPPEREPVPSPFAPSLKLTVPLEATAPLAGSTVAVRVTGAFSATLAADAASDVVVLTPAGLGFTVRLNVALCTRSPLIAHSVTGTV